MKRIFFLVFCFLCLFSSVSFASSETLLDDSMAKHNGTTNVPWGLAKCTTNGVSFFPKGSMYYDLPYLADIDSYTISWSGMGQLNGVFYDKDDKAFTIEDIRGDKDINLKNIRMIVLQNVSKEYRARAYCFNVVGQYQRPPYDFNLNSYTAFHDSIDLNLRVRQADTIDLYVNGELFDTFDGKLPSYKIKGLKPSTTYEFWFVAKNGFGETATNKYHVRTLDPPPPPSNVSLDVGDVKDKSIRLSYSAIDAAEIQIFANSKLVATQPGKSVAYLLSVEPDTDYDLHIVAVNPYGRTASRIVHVKTPELFTAPKSVSLKQESVYVDRVNLRFFAKFAESYKLYRNGALLTTMPGNYVSFADVQVRPNTTYKYEIYAINSLGQVKSDVLEVITLTPPKSDYPKVTIQPASVAFIDYLDVRIFSSDDTARVFYSFDGESWLPYEKSIRINEPKVIYAKAENNAGKVSPVETAHYTLSETPKVHLSYSLKDVADSGRSHFDVLWPIIAFVSGIILCFLAAKAVRQLMDG